MTSSNLTWSDFSIEGARVACMASFPPRYGSLGPVIASLAPQVDWLFLYANETIEGLPRFDLPNVVVLDSNKHQGNLSANGKIYPLKFLKNCFVFTVDDDFIYPKNYVSRYMEVFEAFGNGCCVTTHGGIFLETTRWYYERCKVFAAVQALDRVQLVTLAGSGTFAFHQSTLQVHAEDFLTDVMVDLRLSLAARRQNLPIWCIDRPKSWLHSLGDEGLWQQYRGRITHHTDEVRKHDWSFAQYRNPALQALGRLASRHAGGGHVGFSLDPELEQALETGEPPGVWRKSCVSYTRRAEYLELLEANAHGAAS